MHHSIKIVIETKASNSYKISNYRRRLTYPSRNFRLNQQSVRDYRLGFKRTLHNSERNFHVRRIIPKINASVKCFSSEKSYTVPSLPGISRIFNKKTKTFHKIIWISFLFVCFAASVLQCSNCIQEYLSEIPVGTYDMITEYEVALGTFMFCSAKLSDEVYVKKLLEKHRIHVPIDGDWLPLLNLTMEKIWYQWELPLDKIKIEVKCSVSKNDRSCGGKVIKSFEIKAVLGKCSVFNFEPLKIHGPTTSVIFQFDSGHIFTGSDNLIKVFSLENDKGLKYINIDKGLILNNAIQVRLSIQRLKIRRLKLWNRPCIDSESYSKCQEKCLGKKIMESTTCRLPFMDEGVHPSCKNISQFLENTNLVKMAMKTAICSCPEKCEEINLLYYPSCKIDVGKHPRLELLFSSNKFLLINEYCNYSLLLLFIDIGGSLGLFIGFSLLTFYEIIEVLLVMLIQLNHQKKNSKVVLEQEKPFSVIEEKDFISLTGVDRLTNQNISKIQKIFWWLILFLAFLISSYQVTMIIVDYLHGAPATRNAVQKNDTIQFPIITVCPYEPFLHNPYVMELRYKYAFHFNVNEEIAEKISFFELMRLPDFNISEVWEEITSHKQLISIADHFDNEYSKADVKRVPYLYGSCFSFPKVDLVVYTGLYTRIFANMELDENRKSPFTFMIFLNDHEEETRFLNPRKGFPVPDNVIPLIDIEIIIRKNLNIPGNPCSDAGKVGKCVSDCREKKLNENLPCSLPHLMDSDKKPCDDPEAFRKAFLTAEEVIMESNITDCKCPRKCTDNNYNAKFPVIDVSMNIKLRAVWLIFYFSTNIFVIIEEYYQLTIYTMFAKICGNLCLYLGFCIPNILEFLEFFYMRFIKY